MEGTTIHPLHAHITTKAHILHLTSDSESMTSPINNLADEPLATAAVAANTIESAFRGMVY